MGGVLIGIGVDPLQPVKSAHPCKGKNSASSWRIMLYGDTQPRLMTPPHIAETGNQAFPHRTTFRCASGQIRIAILG